MNLTKLFPQTETKERSVIIAQNQRQSSWLGGLLGFGETKSGTNVTLSTAEAHTAVMSCYTVLAESMANMPLNLMQKKVTKKGKRKKRRAYNHPLYKVLSLQPNSEMTQFQWIEAMMMNCVSRGNAYSQVLRDNRGDIVGFYPLLSDNMTIYRDENGVLEYKYFSSLFGKDFILPQSDILHVKYKTMDGIHGISPIAYSKNSIGLSMALEEHGATHFRNGVSSSGIFELPNKISKDAHDRLREDLRERYTSLKNSGKPLLLEQGLTFKQIGIQNNDAQYLESRAFQKSEIASIFRIPPHLINILDRATFNNIEDQGIYFATNTMQSWVKRFEQPLTILLQGEDPTLYAKFNMDGAVRGNMGSRYEAYGKGITDGWITRNEVREKEGLNPIKGLDDPILPLNMGGKNAKAKN